MTTSREFEFYEILAFVALKWPDEDIGLQVMTSRPVVSVPATVRVSRVSLIVFADAIFDHLYAADISEPTDELFARHAMIQFNKAAIICRVAVPSPLRSRGATAMNDRRRRGRAWRDRRRARG